LSSSQVYVSTQRLENFSFTTTTAGVNEHNIASKKTLPNMAAHSHFAASKQLAIESCSALSWQAMSHRMDKLLSSFACELNKHTEFPA